MGVQKTRHENQSRRAILADLGILCVALFWGGGFVAAKFALTITAPMNVMAYRYLGAAIITFFFCIKRLNRQIDKKMILYGTICGAMLWVGNSLSTIGLQYTTAGKQSFIMSLYMIMVPLMTWAIFGKKPGNHLLIAACVGFVGIALITLTQEFTVGKGDMLTVCLTITFSAQMIFRSTVVKDVDALLFTFVELFVVGSLSAVTALIVSPPFSPLEALAAPLSGLLGLLYLITFNSAFAFILQNICLKYAPVNHAAILLSMETVFGTIAAVTVAGEVFSRRMAVGCILMFVAIGLTEINAFRNLKRNG